MNIIVTGASSGIGYEVVKHLCKEGGHSIIAIARNESALKDLQNMCREQYNGAVEICPGDLTNPDFSMEMGTMCKTHFNSVDVLVNNAGKLINRSFEEISMEEVQEIYEVNVFGVMRLIRACLPMMSVSLSHVVTISSMGGFQGSSKFPGLSAYSSSKAALASLTECLAEEYKEKGVRFNCLALGAVQTEMLEQAFPNFKAPISASEMARFIAHFVCEGHHFFNGKVLPVSLSTP